MNLVVSFLFFLEFFLIFIYFIHNLFNVGFSFKLGISFGLLFFIFIPIFVGLLTGKIPVSITGFGNSGITDVILSQNIKSSLILVLFIFSIIVYLYSPHIKIKKSLNTSFVPLIRSYLFSYVLGMLIVFIGSGLFKGGNWYDNRHNFFESSGQLAVLTAFVLNSTKILIISSLFYKWLKKDFSLIKFLSYTVLFVVLDMFISGNRIYLFCTAIAICFIFFKRYPKKMIFLSPVLIPLVFIMGYFASIFKHIRGPLFEKGLPTFDIFKKSLLRAISLEPPNFKMFFLEISESININVLYKIFNNYDNFLYGATYIKPLFFYFPRSVWATKPESITIIAANNFGGASLVTTIIGEIYMNFYFFGVIILPFLLLFLDYLFTKSLKNFGKISGIILFIIGVLIFRMPFSDELLVFVFLFAILKVTKWINDHKFTFKSFYEI